MLDEQGPEQDEGHYPSRECAHCSIILPASKMTRRAQGPAGIPGQALYIRQDMWLCEVCEEIVQAGEAEARAQAAVQAADGAERGVRLGYGCALVVGGLIATVLIFFCVAFFAVADPEYQAKRKAEREAEALMNHRPGSGETPPTAEADVPTSPDTPTRPGTR